MLHFQLFAQAEDELLQLLEFAPMEGKAWHMLGRCHQIQNRHTKALECFERAACCYNSQNRPEDTPPASSRLARLLWEQGEHAAARTMLALLLNRRPDDEVLLELRKSWSAASLDEGDCAQGAAA